MNPILSSNSESDALAELEELTLSLDPLSTVESIGTIEATPMARLTQSSEFLENKLVSYVKFFLHYCAVSTAVFGILLVATNFSAYSAVVVNMMHPEALQNTSTQIQDTLSQSRITVYANDGQQHATELKEKAEDIKKQLDAEKIKIDEDPFSMKTQIPEKPNISANFEITPYENRIVIPKIGKNIPLVDIAASSTFDFDHMENIFMQELEKGVVRYPGSALPGQNGNTFIFGHSSNYPWVKGNFNDVFALLDNVEFGDQIIVYYNQKKFIYTVREKKIVRPGDVKALERDPNKPELSLMTCWPIGTTLKRMLVFAELTSTN